MKRSTILISALSVVVVISLIVIMVVAIRSVSGKKSGSSSSGNTIELISLNGAISDDAGSSLLSSSGGITPSFVRHCIEDAEKNDSVKAIVLKINSPGGSVGASQEIAYIIRDARVPVIVFGGDMVASGAYYISSQARSIICKPGTLVGSIGVISEFPDLNGLYEKLGIKMQTIKSGRNKDMFSRTLTSEETRKFQTLSDEIYMQFVNDVAEGRGINKTKVKELATGEVFAATQAKKLKLIDEVGGYQDAIDLAADIANIKNPTVEEYKGPSFLDSIFGSTSGEISILRKVFGNQILGSEMMNSNLALLDYARTTFGMPQYRYSGGN